LYKPEFWMYSDRARETNTGRKPDKMQKSVAVIILLASIVVAGSLILLSRELGVVSEEIKQLREQNASLDSRLKQLNEELPGMIEQAGGNAGREAVRGIFDEALGKPARQLRNLMESVTSGVLSSTGSSGFATGAGGPMFHLEISQPSVNIELHTDISGKLPTLSPGGSVSTHEVEPAVARGTIRPST
jgi:hypothetical protein